MPEIWKVEYFLQILGREEKALVLKPQVQSSLLAQLQASSVILGILLYFCFLSHIVGVPTLQSKRGIKAWQPNWSDFNQVSLHVLSAL